MVYARDVINSDAPTIHDYRTKKDILEVFDNPSIQKELSKMIDDYEQKKEGIMTLITDASNATYFITVNLK